MEHTSEFDTKVKKLVRKKKLYLQKVKDVTRFVQCLQEHS